MKHQAVHVTLNNPHDYQCKKYHWWCMQGCKRYVNGECKPNYQLPAIHTEVEIEPSYVCIYEIQPGRLDDNRPVTMFQRGGHADWNYKE